MIIGIAGGVGSGKTTVLKILESKFHAHVYIADEFGHEALLRGNPCYEKIVNEFGNSIIGEDGNISNHKLAEIVFDNKEKLAVLNQIIHPYVWNRIESERKKNDDGHLTVIESAILMEAGYGTICDEIWGVFSSKEKRKKRLVESRGYSQEKMDSIMSAQMKEEELKERCDRIIMNDGDILVLQEQLENLLGTK